VWVEARKSTTSQADKDRFRAFLESGQCRSSPVVRLELYNGARDEAEIRSVDEMLNPRVAEELPLVATVAQYALDALRALAAPGTSVKLGDALIAATAKTHRWGVMSCDWNDFPALVRALGLDLFHPFDGRVLRYDPRYR